jgi:molybdate transport system substrate-binding protein
MIGQPKRRLGRSLRESRLRDGLAARLLLVLALAGFGGPHPARAGARQIDVMISGGFTAPYLVLAPVFEREDAVNLVDIRGPSMGDAPTAIPVRLSRGEHADIVIVARDALDGLVRQGRVVQGSEVDLVRSRIGLAVKVGVPKPDISTVEALKITLLGAKSIVYSDSASGVYVANELFKRLGLVDELAGKARMIVATPVGKIVADGQAEVGFQQLSELLPIPGIQVVGPLPEAVQKITVFSAGISTTAKYPVEARRLIAFLTSRAAQQAIVNAGLEPVSAATK